MQEKLENVVFVGFSSQNLARQKTFAQKRKVRAFPNFFSLDPFLTFCSKSSKNAYKFK